MFFVAPVPTEEGSSRLRIAIQRDNDPCDDLQVVLTSDTEFVFREVDGALRQATVPDLNGARIRAWTREGVDGCPWSADALAIELSEDPA